MREQGSLSFDDTIKTYNVGDTFSVKAKGGENGNIDFEVRAIDERGRAIELSVTGNFSDAMNAASQATWATSAYTTGASNNIMLDYDRRADSPYRTEYAELG